MPGFGEASPSSPCSSRGERFGRGALGFPTRSNSVRREYDRGRWNEAAIWAGKVLKDKPDDREALRLLARSLSRQGRIDLAAVIYGRLGQNEMKGDDYLFLANGLLGENRQAEARAVLVQRA